MSAFLFGDNIELTSSKEHCTSSGKAKINYSTGSIAGSLWVKPHGLLQQQGLQPQQITCFQWQGLTSFFATEGDVPFDILAAAFYLVTRYEEYLPHVKDEYGRFAHTQSLAFKEGFLHLPLVDLWLQHLNNLLQQQFPFYQPVERDFNFTPSYDVDIAYKYKGKNILQQLAGVAKDVVSGNANAVQRWLNTLVKNDDPFDTFAWLDALHAEYNLKPLYFFLVAAKRKGYDKNISPQSTAMQLLIKATVKHNVTGIHPSWQSGDDSTLLQQEINLLSGYAGCGITKSRQHYIRMNLPGTYQTLLQHGITEDYSMGYGAVNGFRASVARPFFWYNLAAEKQTQLLVHPFCFMDANAFFEQHLSAPEAAEELEHYYLITRQVQGHLVTIFHNHFLTLQKQWLPWRQMYEGFMKRHFFIRT